MKPEADDLRAPGYRKVRVLLAYLLMEPPRAHRRDTLAELLWEDLPLDAARARLRRMLFVLRDAIGDPTAAVPLLRIGRDVVQLDTRRPVDVDARRLLESEPQPADHDGAATLAAIVRLYRGPFLEGCGDGDTGTALGAWLTHWRDVLHTAQADRLKALCRFHQAAGELRQAAEFARHLTVLEPDDQAHLRLLMEVLSAAGQADEAGAHYLAFRRRLQEWGEEPTPETRALAERLRLTAPVQPPPAPEARSLERRPATVLSLR